MQRREFVAATGTAIGAGVAGCLGGESGTSQDGGGPGTDSTTTGGGTTNAGGTPAGDCETGNGASLSAGKDGYPKKSEIPSVPEERSISTNFATTERDGVEVPLLPMDVTYYWWARREARFADARPKKQYDAQHIVGAVSNPYDVALDGPAADWSKCDRIVCYCGCPHHLSSILAAKLIDAGYENVYVIDEGYWEWKKAGHPVAGEKIGDDPLEYVVDGRTAPKYAGETAWIEHPETGQAEATEIGSDGRYRLHVRFVDVGPDATVVVETPGYTVRGELGALADGTVDPGRD